MQCTEDGKGDIALHGEDRTARASTQLTLRQYCFAVFPNTHSQYCFAVFPNTLSQYCIVAF